MKCIICDDEKSQIEILRSYIYNYVADRKNPVEVLEYSSCENLWWDLQDGLYADLILLDIQMLPQPGVPDPMSGMELAYKMRSIRPDCNILGLNLGDQYIPHGSMDSLYSQYGLDAQSIKSYVLEVHHSEN